MLIDLYYYLLIAILLQILLNSFFIYVWQNSVLKKFHEVYQSEQKIHDGFIPRFGGLAMLVALFAINYFLPTSWMTNLLSIIFLCLSPLFFVTFLEDTYNNIQPLARLIFILSSSFLIFIFSDFDLPVVDIPVFSDLFNQHAWLFVLILIIAVSAMVNAFNFIDGLNGLLLFNFISIFLCLLLMSNDVGSQEWLKLLTILITISFIQLIFNFPKAFIFSGDLGAYSFGFIISILIVVFFGQFPNFLSWQAILILFYPICEFLFTFIRRLWARKNLFRADRLHLHQLLFSFLETKLSNKLSANALATILLAPLWGFPLFWIYLHGIQLSLLDNVSGILLSITLYLIYYFFCLKINHHRNEL